jgi:homoserine kinase
MVRSVTVRVPATSANLGPGFDSLGLALTLSQEITVSLSPQAEPAAGLARLTLDAARAAYRLARVEAPAELCAVAGDGRIPIGRGLGASAAARAAGIVAADALMGGKLSPEQMLTLGANLEGHADNMAPALFGGLRVVVRDGDRYLHVEAPVASGLQVVLFVPEFDMPTNESRKLLPESLSRADAVHNIGRTAMLVAALGIGSWEMLDIATRDTLHQPARTRLFGAMPEIFAAARKAGAHGAYLSGGGSTVAAFATSNMHTIASAMADAARDAGYRGTTAITEPAREGTRITIST